MGRFVRLDSLTLRLAFWITLLVVALLAVGLYAISRHDYDHTIEARQKAAELQSRILDAALRHQMLERNRALLGTILKEIGAQPEVRTAMILDHKGVIRFSSQPSLVGTEIRRDSPTCMACHWKRPEERDRWIVLEGIGAGVLRSVLPIENRPECYECHSPERRINGILILDISLEQIHAQLRRDAWWMAAGTGVLALFLLLGVSLLVRQVILVRLARLGRTARSIAAGNLHERAEVGGRDVIATLAGDFNNMAEAAARLIAEVRDQETQLANVMNSLDDGLVVLDRKFRVVGCNRSFCRLLGTHPEALRGQRCCVAVQPNLPCCRSNVGCPAARCMETGELQRAVFREPTGNGDAMRVDEVYASPVLDERGEVVQVVEIWRDISERVREEERLAEIEHLASLGVLASGFSHEMNTPLASMLTCAEAAIGRIDDSATDRTGEPLLPAVRDYADTIRNEVLRCRRITEQFLRFARGIPPSVEPLDLRQVVSSVVALAAATARGAGVAIAVEGEETTPAVRANTEVVQHVVLNLVINAIQSCGDRGGRVVVRVQTGADVRIQVRDTGCGIPPEARQHLFEPFRSQKPQGTGLGLFLSRTFMRRFGGDVRLAETEVGVGTCFEIVFSPAGSEVP